jgi:putative sterol carrier protein
MAKSKPTTAVTTITKDFTETSKEKTGFGKKVKLDFGTDGVIMIDGTGKKIAISNDDHDADMTVVLTVDTFTQMGEGKLAGDKAVEQGLLTIDGDLSLAKVLEDTLSGN